MNRILVALLLLSVGAAGLQAQSRNPADSLKRSLKVAPEHKKAEVLNTLSDTYRTMHFDSSLAYAKQALELSRRLGQLEQEHNALMQLAMLSFAQAQYDTALNHLSFLSSGVEVTNFTKYKANNIKGLTLLRKGEARGALDAFYLSLRFAEKEKDPLLQLKPLTNIGLTFMELGQFEKAIGHFRKAIENAPNDDARLMAITCSNMAACFGALKQLDSVKHYALLSLKYAELLGDPQATANSLNILSTYYQDTKQFDSAAIVLIMAQPYRQHLRDPYFQIADLLNLAQVYSKQGKLTEAKRTMLTAKRIADSTNMLMKFENLYLVLGQTEQKLGNYKEAAAYFHQWGVQKDTIYAHASSEALADLQVRYDVASHEKANLLLRNRQQETERDNAVKSTWITGLAGSLVVLVLLFVVLSMRRQYREKAKRYKEEQRLEMTRFRSIVEGESRERERLAKELHDGLGQLLVTSKINIDAMPNKDEHSEQAMVILEEAIGELRNMSHNLMPAALTRIGLLAALRDMRSRIESASIQCPWELPEKLTLSKEDERNIFRIIQEIVNNMLRHAQAKTIFLTMENQQEGLSLVLKDDGVGFDSSSIEQSGGMGWDNIRFRVKLFDGRFELSSSKGSGTKVAMFLPFRNPQSPPGP